MVSCELYWWNYPWMLGFINIPIKVPSTSVSIRDRCDSWQAHVRSNQTPILCAHQCDEAMRLVVSYLFYGGTRNIQQLPVLSFHEVAWKLLITIHISICNCLVVVLFSLTTLYSTFAPKVGQVERSMMLRKENQKHWLPKCRYVTN